jgi:tetratricopeptide (TPR) repeat protein
VDLPLRYRRGSVSLTIAALLFASAALVAAGAPTDSGELLKRLERALTDHDTQQAQRVQDELLSSKPSLDVLLSAGGLLAEHDMLQNSADVFEKCVAMYPQSFEAHYDLAFALLNLGKPQQAFAALSSARTGGTTEEAAAHYLRGKIYEATGDLQRAREDFVAANRARPREENYALDLALLYLRSYAYVPAIDVLQPTSEYHPESRELKLELALANALAGRRAAALELCRDLQTDPALSSSGFLIAAFAECMNSDFEACSKQAQLGLAARNPHPYLYYLDANALWNLNPANPERALGQVNIAIGRLPACVTCLELRSKILEAGGNNRSASADLEKVVRQNPQASSAWYRLAQLYKKLGLKQESADCLRRYQSIRNAQANQEAESFRQQFLSGKSASN